jgi:hypothetical protein
MKVLWSFNVNFEIAASVLVLRQLPLSLIPVLAFLLVADQRSWIGLTRRAAARRDHGGCFGLNIVR